MGAELEDMPDVNGSEVLNQTTSMDMEAIWKGLSEPGCPNHPKESSIVDGYNYAPNHHEQNQRTSRFHPLPICLFGNEELAQVHC